jgi:hypothetical protein
MNFRLVFHSGKILALAALFFASSCKKDITNPLKGSDESAAASISDSSTVADNAYNDVFVNAFYTYSDNQLNGAASWSKDGRVSTNSVNGVNSIHLSCATYKVDTTLVTRFPVTVTVDFGTDGCTSAFDGLNRKGKIIYVFSGPLLAPGTTVSASFDHYFVNGYGLQGSCSITNNSDQNGFSFSAQITNGIFTFPDLTNFHYSGNKTIQMSAGSNTPFDFSDDVYAITGSSNFSASDGSSLVSTITTPLTKALSCLYIGGGTVSFVYDQVVSGTIDFGDGSCDNKATLNVGSVSREITLR